MPVEIRELVIKTHISSPTLRMREDELVTAEKMQTLKQQVTQECMKLIKEKMLKLGFDR